MANNNEFEYTELEGEVIKMRVKTDDLGKETLEASKLNCMSELDDLDDCAHGEECIMQRLMVAYYRGYQMGLLHKDFMQETKAPKLPKKGGAARARKILEDGRKKRCPTSLAQLLEEKSK